MAEVMIEIMVGVNPNGDWMSVMMSGSDGADIASAKEFITECMREGDEDDPTAFYIISRAIPVPVTPMASLDVELVSV